MSSYKEICNTLNNLREQNKKLKTTIEKYKSGEIEEMLNEVILLVQENEILEREISKLYIQTYDKVVNKDN